MNRAYEYDPDMKREVFSDYIFNFKLAGNGCELEFDFVSPSEVEVCVSTSTPATGDCVIFGLTARMSHKKTLGLKINALQVAFAVQDGAVMLSNDDT